MSVPSNPGYAGDVTGNDCLTVLRSDPDAILVDVRTKAEWSYVGIPDLTALGKDIVLVEWQVFPAMTVNPAFVEQTTAELQKRKAGKDSPVFFLCRSGVRSMSAATAMTAAGFTRCYNVSGGFEGPPDQARHRGVVAGWKAEGLPWVQT